MRRRVTLLAGFGALALAVLVPEVRAAGLDLADSVHSAFVVVFVDAANFVAGCF